MGKASRRKRERREEEPQTHVILPHAAQWPIPVEIFAGARLSWFVEPDERGRWRLVHFTRSEEAYGQELLEAHYTAHDPEVEKSRVVPPGDYVSLQRRMTERERLDTLRKQLGRSDIPQALAEAVLPPESQWVPIMSDTPAEIVEHGPALLKASGRVLITGLGLGCLPHALLNFDNLPEEVTGGREIERIDIIEIDPDVIALTGHYLTADPRVHIWEGSAANLDTIPKDVRQEGWTYAWHDIWSHISSRNLNDEEAEHGISYRMLFDLWLPYTRGPQDAWAFEGARRMREIEAREREGEMAFRRKLRAASLDDQVHMVLSAALIDRFQFNENTRAFAKGDLLPMEFLRQCDPDGSLERHVRDQLADGSIWEKFSPDHYEDEPHPLGKPNEEQ